MQKRYAIKVQGHKATVSKVDITTPLPIYGEKLPSAVIVHAVEFSDHKTHLFIDPDLANAVADGIRNMLPVRIEVIDTWRK